MVKDRFDDFGSYFQAFLVLTTGSTIIAEPILIFVDEIDSTLSLNFTDDFFTAIRYLYNARAIEPTLHRLSFVLLGVAIPGDLINDPQRTPFNIGQRVELSDFSTEETLPLAKGFVSASHEARQVVQWILRWTGGHPYLTQRLCAYLAQQRWNPIEQEQVEQAVATLFYGEQSEQDNNLQFVRDMLTRRSPDLRNTLATYRAIHRGDRVRDDEQSLVKSHLKLSGIVLRQNNLLRVRNRIYQEVFDQRWIKEHWPLRWWASIPKGIKIAAGLVTMLSIALFFTTIWAVEGQKIAQNAQATAVAAQATAIAERDIARAQRNEALAGQLVMYAKSYVDTQMDLAVLLSLEANRLSDHAEIRSSLPAVMEANPKLMTYLQGHQETIWDIALSRDGNLLASVDSSGMICFWDVKTGKILKKLQTDWGSDIALNSDGTLLASGDADGTIHLWDVTMYQQVGLLSGHKEFITSIAFHPYKNQLVSSSYDGGIILWDVSTGQQLARSQAVSQRVPKVIFAPDGKIIAITNNSGVVLWNAGVGEETLIPSSEEFFGSFEFSPNGKTIALNTYRGVELWDIATKKKIQLCSVVGVGRAIAFSPDGNILALGNISKVGGSGHISLCNPQTGKILEQLSGHSATHPNLFFSPEGDRLISAHDKTIIIWNLTSSLPRLHRSLPVASSTIEFAPNGKTLASSDEDGSISIWDTIQGTERLHLQTNITGAVNITFGSDGQRLIARDFKNSKITVWNIIAGQTIQQYDVHNKEISSIAYDNQGRLLAAGCSNEKVVIWEVNKDKLLESAIGSCNSVLAPNFSADGTLLTWDFNRRPDVSIMVWDVVKQQLVHEIEYNLPYSDFIYSYGLWYSNNHVILAYTGSKTTIHTWDITTGQQIGKNVNVYDLRFPTIALSQDSSRLALGGYDNKIVLYDTKMQEPMFEIQGKIEGSDPIAISNNGDYLAFANQSANGSTQEISLWHLNFEEWREKACRFVNRNLSQEEWQRFLGDEPYRETCPALTSSETP
jgi:WD40 repeat protein